MSERLSHLVFYDGECGLCDRFVQLLLTIDHHQIFVFAPLQGSTAAQYIAHLPPELKQADSIILVEDFKSKEPKVQIQSKAVFRIAWLLGGAWTLLGWLFFLPAFLFDWGYRLVARNRHRLFPPDQCVLPKPEQRERFLP